MMNQKKIKLVLFASIFIDYIGLGILFPLLPFYAQKFDADPGEIGLLFALYSLMQFIFAPLWGSLSDRFGRRIILLASIAGSGLSYFWFAFANSLLSLFLARALAGIMGNSALVAKGVIISDGQARSPSPKARLYNTSVGQHLTEVKG